jgi:hypothetical protein
MKSRKRRKGEEGINIVCNMGEVSQEVHQILVEGFRKSKLKRLEEKRRNNSKNK